jgi:hypothetical protein
MRMWRSEQIARYSLCLTVTARQCDDDVTWIHAVQACYGPQAGAHPSSAAAYRLTSTTVSDSGLAARPVVERDGTSKTSADGDGNGSCSTCACGQQCPPHRCVLSGLWVCPNHVRSAYQRREHTSHSQSDRSQGTVRQPQHTTHVCRGQRRFV